MDIQAYAATAEESTAVQDISRIDEILEGKVGSSAIKHYDLEVGEKAYTMIVSGGMQPVNQAMGILKQILPYILGISAVIAVLFALGASFYLTAPVVRLSQRTEDFKLTGVRIATEEEYRERTKEEEKLQSEALTGQTAAEEKVRETVAAQEEDVEAYAVSDPDEEDAIEDVCEESSTEAVFLTREEQEENERKIQEYGQAGISYDETGAWLWKGEPIYILGDEDGSLYQNGSYEAKKNKIYVLVKRNSDGSIKEARQLTMEEAIGEKMSEDGIMP